MAPLLTLLDFNATFTAESDACNTGIGAVLSQGGRFIAYFNKALEPKHQALPKYEKEMLAILATVIKWNSLMLGRHFLIKNNHQSL